MYRKSRGTVKGTYGLVQARQDALHAQVAVDVADGQSLEPEGLGHEGEVPAQGGVVRVRTAGDQGRYVDVHRIDLAGIQEGAEYAPAAFHEHVRVPSAAEFLQQEDDG